MTAGEVPMVNFSLLNFNSGNNTAVLVYCCRIHSSCDDIAATECARV